MPEWTDAFSFTTGAVRNKGRAYMIATEDRLAKKQIPHSAIVSWEAGEWGQCTLKWSATSVCIARTPKEQMIAVGEEGPVFVLGGGDDYEEELRDGKLSPEERGPMTCVRPIDGKAWAGGTGRQVYVREDKGKWRCIDESMRATKEDGMVGINGLDGFSSKDVYAAGFKGEVWHWNGKKWAPVDSPTNLILNDVCCGEDGTVYIAGFKGLLLRGDKKKLEIVKHEKTKENIWGMAWYGKKLYLSTLTRVFTLEKGDELKTVDMDEPVTSAYHLSTADGVLWSIGPKDIMAFDGKTWTRIE